MANQYHDAEGKFCSKGGMIASIESLAQKQDWAGYQKLRDDYEEITGKTYYAAQAEAGLAPVTPISSQRHSSLSNLTTETRQDVLRKASEEEIPGLIRDTENELGPSDELDDATFNALAENPELDPTLLVNHQNLRYRHAAQLATKFDLPFKDAKTLVTRKYGNKSAASHEKADRDGRDKMMDALIENESYTDEESLELATANKWRTLQNLDAYANSFRRVTPEFEQAVADNLDGGEYRYNHSIRAVATSGKNEAVLTKLAEKGFYDTTNYHLTDKVVTAIVGSQKAAFTMSATAGHLRKHTGLSEGMRAVLDESPEKAPKVNFDDTWKKNYDRLAAQKTQPARRTDYLYAKAQLDAQDEAWSGVEKLYADAQKKYADGTIQESRFESVKTRWQLARNLRKQAGLAEAFKGL